VVKAGYITQAYHFIASVDVSLPECFLKYFRVLVDIRDYSYSHGFHKVT
jgi:hypothetical protein